VRYIFFLAICFLFACDPCNECDVVIFEPTVEMVFINQDSLNSLNDSIDNNLSRDSILTDSISFFSGEVNTLSSTLKELKDSGNNDTLEIFNQILSLNTQITQWRVESDTISSKNSQMNAVISIINSGSVKLTALNYRETGGSLVLADDSATVFSLPISYDKSFLTYDLTIEGDSSYYVTIDFDLVEETDVRRNVLIKAENIRVVDTDFQAFDNCETNCTDSEAVFTFYF